MQMRMKELETIEKMEKESEKERLDQLKAYH